MMLPDPCAPFMSPATTAMNQTLDRLDPCRPLIREMNFNRVETPSYLKPNHDICYRPAINPWEPKPIEPYNPWTPKLVEPYNPWTPKLVEPYNPWTPKSEDNDFASKYPYLKGSFH